MAMEQIYSFRLEENQCSYKECKEITIDFLTTNRPFSKQKVISAYRIPVAVIWKSLQVLSNSVPSNKQINYTE